MAQAVAGECLRHPADRGPRRHARGTKTAGLHRRSAGLEHHRAELRRIAWVGRHDYQPSESVSDEVPRAKKVAGKASWKSKLFTAWRAAAAVGGLALAGTFGYLQFSGTPEHVVETRAAQWQRMALQDGSTIHLDARTRIEVEFSAARRIIHLIHGSAVFDVVKDHHRPFVVKAGHVEVTAVGTRFGVDRDDGVRTTVEDGIVEVRARDGRDDQSVLLHKGQQLYVAPESRSMLSVAAIAEVDAKRELSWVTGRLEMADTTLGEIVRQFNRRQRIQAEIRDAELADRPVDLALMQVDNVEDFVEVMESRGVTVIRDGSTLILRASGTR